MELLVCATAPVEGRLMRGARVLAALNCGSPRFDIRFGRGMEVMLIGFGTAVWKTGVYLSLELVTKRWGGGGG